MVLHPDFPIVEGQCRLTREWELELPGRFNRRIEDGNMVIWRPGLTFWIAVWEPLPEATAEGTLAWILKDASTHRVDETIARAGGLIRLSYRVREHDPDRYPQDYLSISGHVIAPSALVQISAYCDGPEDERTGGEVIGSVQLSAPAPLLH